MTVHRVNLTVESVEDYFDTVLARGFRREPEPVAAKEASDSPGADWSPVILALMEVLEEVTLHPPSRDRCRELGHRAGVESAEALDRVRDPGVPKAEILLAMPPILSGTGFGTSELLFDDQQDRLVWTFDMGTVLGKAAREMGEKEEPACAFFEGLAAGWAKGSLGLRLRISERDCVARGDSACRFQS